MKDFKFGRNNKSPRGNITRIDGNDFISYIDNGELTDILRDNSNRNEEVVYADELDTNEIFDLDSIVHITPIHYNPMNLHQVKGVVYVNERGERVRVRINETHPQWNDIVWNNWTR